MFTNFDLSESVFTDCTFTGCSLSAVKLNGTALRNVRFKDCKLTGLPFENCTDFLMSLSFENCILNLSSFIKLKLEKTVFRGCEMREVNFASCNLTSAVFNECDLACASFEKTLLEKADFRSAYNFSIDPENNRIKKARFSSFGIAGLLDKYDIVIE
jgi:uncharacterized protein YjbI with pentapeptide repeats